MTGEPLGPFETEAQARAAAAAAADPVIEVLRSAADALAVDLAAWEVRDPGDPSPEARRARRAAIATADAVITAVSRLQTRLGGDRP